MKRDIILAGVGGQGILTIATIVGYAAVKKDWHLKQAEVHGMSQRGGDVQSHLRLSDRPIHSDLIPEGSCDMIISLEPMEALRYVPFLSPSGWIIANKKPFINIAGYPPVEQIWREIELRPRSILLDGDAMAREAANARSVNIVVLGASASHLGMAAEELEEAIRFVFARKSETVVEANIRAFRAGRDFALQRERTVEAVTS